MEVADGGEGVVAGGAQLVAWQWDLEWCTQLVLRPNRNQTVYSYDKMHLRITGTFSKDFFSQRAVN